MTSRYDHSRRELTALLGDQPAYRSRQLWDGLYRRGLEPEEMTDLPLALRRQLAEALPAALRPLTSSTSPDGSTVKWLFELSDGARIETVLMHYPRRSTVCISTQAGCAMGCAFCATGQAGFERHLSSGEIVEQVIRARRDAHPRRISNVVLMGMGEPLANYEASWTAIERLVGDLGISARGVTISTVGLVPGIRRLSREALPVNLAVSLHLADDERRNLILPVNRRYPLAELMEACQEHLRAKNRRISFEWALIDRLNDSAEDALRLAALARPLRAHVNLIPLNPTPGYAQRGSPPAQVACFRDELRRLGVRTTVRESRGWEIDAACGQLRATSAAHQDSHAVAGTDGIDEDLA